MGATEYCSMMVVMEIFWQTELIWKNCSCIVLLKKYHHSKIFFYIDCVNWMHIKGKYLHNYFNQTMLYGSAK